MISGACIRADQSRIAVRMISDGVIRPRRRDPCTQDSRDLPRHPAAGGHDRDQERRTAPSSWVTSTTGAWVTLDR